MIFLLAASFSLLGEMAAEKTAIVFGGNGFMGSETVMTILPHFDKVIVVNRGNWYYDSNRRINGRKGVYHIKCDRFKQKHENNLLNCPDFVKEINKIKDIDVVIDFSAYKPKGINDAVHALKSKIKLYVYISSDSVYEVCEGYDSATSPSKETDAIRPKDPELRDFLRHEDSYGDEKLAGEEVLVASGVPYVILRLPDVLGPRDTTHRWWTYQIWIQYFNMVKRPLPIPLKYTTLKTSYVFSKDVATTVLKVVQLSETDSQILNEAYNIGFERGFSPFELLQEIAREVGVSDVIKYEHAASDEAFSLFPSVSRGMVDISKAKTKLRFAPTPWRQALKETVAFYRDSLIAFPTERDQAVETLLENVIAEKDQEAFNDFLREITSSEQSPGTCERNQEAVSQLLPKIAVIV